MNWVDLNWEKSYWPIGAYSQSKLANILFTKELETRLKDTNITSVCLHPGLGNLIDKLIILYVVSQILMFIKYEPIYCNTPEKDFSFGFHT